MKASLILVLLFAACPPAEPKPDLGPRDEGQGAASDVRVAGSSGASIGSATGPREAPTESSTAPLLELVRAPAEASVLPFIRTERGRAERDGRTLLVLVGAEWCAPCRGFHKRLKESAVRARVRIVEFDVDEHDEGLKAAGYVSTLIPLLAKPRPDGRPETMKEVHSKKEDGAEDLLRLVQELGKR